jgi:DNA-binding transcriptional MerR regulator
MNGYGFSAKQAAGIAGLPYETVDYWASTKFIMPSIASARGTGTRREYSFPDLVALRVASKLRENGISLQGLRKVVAHLEKIGIPKPPLATTYLVSDGTEVYTKQGDELFALLKRPGQVAFFFVLDLTATYQVVEEAIRKIGVAA